MLKHRFVFVSKDSAFKVRREETAKLAAECPMLRFDYVADNKSALADVYNIILDEDVDSDFIYLMHADISLNFIGLAKQVETLDGKYDVMGLCGCAKISVSQSPLNWFCGSRPFPMDRWGCVTHGELGNQTSFFNQHSPDVTDHEVACIDGLCIIFTRKAISSGLRFDNKLGQFDFYDTDISMQAVMKYGMKLGVIVRKDLIHYSIGKSILTQDFLKNEVKFRNKWNFPPPPNSPIAGMMAQPGQV